MAETDIVTLQSQDGLELQVEVRFANQSVTIKNLIEDAGTKEKIPLPNVKGVILAKIIEYLKYHGENPTVVTDDKSNATGSNELVSWDLEFCKVDQATLFELILAANYLDIKELLDLTCKSVANMIKGLTPDEIRKTFGIVNDFTADEERQVREENAWCCEA